MSGTPLNKSSLRRISTLEEHRALLVEVIRTAKSRVLIVSPFISDSVVRHDGLTMEISRAVSRGVTVSVYTDHHLNLDTSGSIKPSAEKGIAALLKAGAQVKVVDGIHNKTLGRDDELITEGSFNWLSAVRTRGEKHQREERTLVYEGEEANSMVEKEIKQLESIRTTDDIAEENRKINCNSFFIRIALVGLVIAAFFLEEWTKGAGAALVAFAILLVILGAAFGKVGNRNNYKTSDTDDDFLNKHAREFDEELRTSPSYSHLGGNIHYKYPK